MPSITLHYRSHENTTLTSICLCRLHPREITRDSLRNKLRRLTQKLASSCHRLQISAPTALLHLLSLPFILPTVFFTSWCLWPTVPHVFIRSNRLHLHKHQTADYCETPIALKSLLLLLSCDGASVTLCISVRMKRGGCQGFLGIWRLLCIQSI